MRVQGPGDARRAPRMRDVARLAGVSHQTVSRVVNGSPQVLPETRTRVVRAIESLGYVPERGAGRAPAAPGDARTAGVGVVVWQMSPASTATAEALAAAARRAGRAVHTVTVPDGDHDRSVEALRALLRLDVAGLLAVTPPRTATRAVRDLPRALPVVVADGDVGPGPTAVQVDHHHGSRLVTEHLLSLGHRTVHHVAGPQSAWAAAQRVAGWRDALQDAGLTCFPVMFTRGTPAAGHEVGRVLAGDPSVTAVQVYDDACAVGVLRALQDAGRRVPQDVSVAGHDDLPEAEFVGPGLTTVRPGVDRLAATSVRVLEQLLAREGDVPALTTVVPELVVRGSTGPASW